MLDLFPVSARIETGELVLGGLRGLGAGRTLRHAARRLLRGDAARAGARAPRRDRRAASPTAPRPFRTSPCMRLLREEGIGADVASAGELAFARAAGLTGDELIVHGNNKDEAFLAEAAALGATVVLDAPDEAALAAASRGAARARASHARRRRRHARGDPDRAPRLEVRPARPSKRCALVARRARARARRARAARACRLAARGLRRPGGDDRPPRLVRRPLPATRWAGPRGSPISAAASASATTPTSR